MGDAHQLAPRQGGEHADLPVGNLAHPADVLPRHAHALLARLLPAALVEQQPLLARLARKAVLCASGHVHHHALRVPVRLADEVLKLLVVTAGDAFLHTLYITFTLVEKTFQRLAVAILLAARCAVLAPASEVIPVGTGVDVNFFSSKFGKAITIK